MVSVREAVMDEGLITFDEVEQALVDVIELWRRSPSGGRGSPWAGDAPWDLGDQPLYGPDVDKDVPLRAAPLSVDEVGVRDAVSGWLELVPERDRRLVMLAVNQMSRKGYGSPAFLELRRDMGIALGADGLRKRYNRALYGVVRHMNCNADARKAAGLRR